MKGKYLRFRLLSALGALAIFLPTIFGAVAEATPSSYNDPNFQMTWERTDKPVQDGMTARSWMWGPGTLTGSPEMEPYEDSPSGQRVVQYFDKGRMEVNDPNGDRSQLWFVTNGLLVKEMVSGEVQTGNENFSGRAPATEAVAGDPVGTGNTNCPTYGTFQNIASLRNDNSSVIKSGVVSEFIDKTGNVTTGSSPDSSVAYGYFDAHLNHNIPNVFLSFMTQIGPVYWNGAWGTDNVIDWVFAMGYPITEPFWTKARVAGQEVDVLVQLFERRVLTYTPSNPEGFKVEMGNVGQHYFRWRHPSPAGDIVFVSGGQVMRMDTFGANLSALTESAGVNWYPRWSPGNSRIVFQSSRDGNEEIYVMDADGSNEQRLTFDSRDDDRPAWSPDGGRIIWSRDGDIYTMASDGTDVQQITSGARWDSSPAYSPDGHSFAWSGSPEPGEAAVYRAKLDGTAIQKLTEGPADYPTDWQQGKILFTRAVGVSWIWSMNDDGSDQINLAGSHDDDGRFSPDGNWIVFKRFDQIGLLRADGSSVNVSYLPRVFRNGAAMPDWSN